MEKTLDPKVQSTLANFINLSDEEKRQFYWALQNPVKVSQGLPPPEPPSDPWQVFTLADAYQMRPPVEYIAAGLFALPSLNIVYGSPGTLKSFLLADLAISAAAGTEWLPPAPWVNGNIARSIPTRQCPVMWLDFDNGRRRTHDRFGALGNSRSLATETPLYYYSMPSPWLDASNKASIGGLSLRIQDRGVKFVIVDNLGVVSGDANENSGDMVAVMSEFRQLAEETSAAVVLIHHQRKGNGTIGRAGDSLRGHSSIEAALDLALLVEREELSDTVNIKATKVRGADVLPFSAVFTYEDRPDGELQNAQFYGIAAEDNRSGVAIEREILLALINTAMNKTDLTKTVKGQLSEVGINRIRDRIDRMASTGKLRVSNGKNNTEKIYSRT
ncbi:MAG: AAA family ATPase [Anaerolineales bacterium]|jgi:hypothetical protein